MIKIIDTSSVETCSLKNNHNQLYLSLMHGLERKKQGNEPSKKASVKQEVITEEDLVFDAQEDPKESVLKEVDNYLKEARKKAKLDIQSGKHSYFTGATIYSNAQIDSTPMQNKRQEFSADLTNTSRRGKNLSFQNDDPYDGRTYLKSQAYNARNRIRSQSNIMS